MTVEEALTLVEKTGERHWEAELHRIKAQILLAEGDTVGAESNLLKAIAVARQQEAKSWELRAAIDLSRLWQSIGEKEKAWHTLSEIYDWFSEDWIPVI
jgi:adenylate cyclase